MDNKNLPVRLTSSTKGINLHPDNPFKDEIERWMNREQESNRSMSLQDVTVIVHKRYLPGGWTRMYKREELLSLSPYASKAFMYIALNMDWEQQKIKLNMAIMGMDRRTASDALVELMAAGIIRQEKRGVYWVNLSFIVMGNINKPI